jgi:hypothetical protein
MSKKQVTYQEEVKRACDWLTGSGYKGEFSELGQRTAVLFERLWGLHHLHHTSLRKVDWSNDYWIEFVYNHELATYDFDSLTILVVLAHQLMLRVSISGAAPGYVRLQVNKRTTRTEGRISERCPHIGDVVERLVKAYPAIDSEVQQDGA